MFVLGRCGQKLTKSTEINSLSMKNKGAALGTATNWLCEISQTATNPVSPRADRNCSRQLHRSRNHSNRHQLSPLEVLHHLDSVQRRFRTARLPVLSRDCRQNAGRHRQILHGARQHLRVQRQGERLWSSQRLSCAIADPNISRLPLLQSALPSTSSMRSPRYAVIAALTREVLQWRWRGTETACRLESKGTIRRSKTKRIIVKGFEIVKICSHS